MGRQHVAKKKYIIDEKALSKGQLRKLNALRKSVGEDLGNEAFCRWYEEQASAPAAERDPNVELMEKALMPHYAKFRFPSSPLTNWPISRRIPEQ
jgi:hypothetical protein